MSSQPDIDNIPIGIPVLRSNSDDYEIAARLEVPLVYHQRNDNRNNNDFVNEQEEEDNAAEEMRQLQARRDAAWQAELERTSHEATRTARETAAAPPSGRQWPPSEELLRQQWLARQEESFFACCDKCSSQQRATACGSFIMFMILAGIVAGFVIAGKQGDLREQCPSEFARVNVSGDAVATLASSVPPAKWLFVFSGTSIVELLLFLLLLGAAGPSGDRFQGLQQLMCVGCLLILMLVFKFAWATVGLVLVSQSTLCSDTNKAAKTVITLCGIWTYFLCLLCCPVMMLMLDNKL